jgi:sugar porter (SP) family MFS transporter
MLTSRINSGATEPPRDASILYVIAISLAAAVGGLMFGWDWVVIGGAKPFFERYFAISNDPSLSGWANSCALLGCFFGAITGGALSDILGRKRPLLVAALLFGVASAGNAMADTFSIFVAWRVAGGIAIGLASSLSPLYIAEIAPAHMRGRLVALNQVAIMVGILAAQLINWWLVRDLPADATDAYIAGSWYGQTAWRWMFAIKIVPSVLFLTGMALAPESPRWLAKRRPAEARALLARIGGAAHADDAIEQIANTVSRKEYDWRALFKPEVRRLLIVGVVLAVFQQWCGVNVIFNYSEEIFGGAGFDISATLANVAWTGSVNLVFTLVALGLVDRFGRKPLMLFGAAGLALIYTTLGVCFGAGVSGLPMLVLVLAAIGCFAMSLAPVTWVVISEIFPNHIRGAAIAVSAGALWLASFALTYTFPILNDWIGSSGVFYLYACVCVAGFGFVLRNLPETKGRTLEELEHTALRGPS